MTPAGGWHEQANKIIERVKISEVWAALGGGPLRHGRGRAFWRQGDGYNVAVSDAKNCWHDFVTDDAGGVLDLVQHVRGGSRAEALRFIAELAGIAIDSKPFPRQERRVYARRRRQAACTAQQCAWWARAIWPQPERKR